MNLIGEAFRLIIREHRTGPQSVAALLHRFPDVDREQAQDAIAAIQCLNNSEIAMLGALLVTEQSCQQANM